jgi:phage tail P2-like protein
MSKKTLQPPGSTELERAIVLTPEIDRLDPERIPPLWHPATCPAAALPWLAWALSVDEWDATAPEETQRAIIAASIGIHKIKGSVASVKTALSVMGHTGKLTEWWQMDPPGPAHTFLADVEIDGRGIDLDMQRSIERAIDAVKPARSHYMMRLVASTHGRSLVCGVITSGEVSTLYPYIRPRLDIPALVSRIGIGTLGADTTTIQPWA